MRIAAVADLHGRLPVIPDCDVLVIAGDFCAEFEPLFRNPDLTRIRQTEWLNDVYAEWEKTVPASRILVTPGNHDFITKLPFACRSEFYVDDGPTIDNVRFWLMPWTIPIGNWNYGMVRSQRKQTYADIPEGVDVLVSHGPAHKVLDRSHSGEHIGCPELRQAIYNKHPRVCVFGHCHEGQRDGGNPVRLGMTDMYNVAKWGASWAPTIIDLP